MPILNNLPVSNELPELRIATNAVHTAGKAIMEIYNKDFSYEIKSDNSPITKADLISNKIIKKKLASCGYPILSEEEKDDCQRLESKKIWIVDPLDGTLDFVKRTGEFTVMIALVENKKPVLGVINCPIKRTMYIAQLGSGAYRFFEDSWNRMSVSNIDQIIKCRAVVSRHHLSEVDENLLSKLGVSKFTSIGSSLKVGIIGSGSAEIYLTTTTRMYEWDTCASYCLINEAGGKMTDILGNDINYNNKTLNHKNGILVTNGFVHNQILEVIRKSGK